MIVPDLRGFGRSDKPPRIEDYRSEERQADIVGLLDALGHDSVYLAGHDFGGFVAWNLAIRHPERVRKLVVFNVAHPRGLSLAAAARARARDDELVPDVLPAALPARARAAQRPLVSARPQPDRIEPPRQLSPSRRSPTTSRPGRTRTRCTRCSIGTARASATRPSCRTIRACARPRASSGGASIATTIRSFAAPSLSHCLDGKLVRFEDAGHWLLHEKPAETSELLIQFFREP